MRNQSRRVENSLAVSRVRALRLRAGDIVEVRSREEILATLDSEGKLEKLPFMPEMLAFCGKQFRVLAVAHKTCDPAHKTGGRRLEHAVHLEGLRCDGSEHGACQAACLLFWKTDWLKMPGTAASAEDGERPTGRMTVEQLRRATIAAGSSPRGILYSCQATCLFEATQPLQWWDARQYLRDVTSGNVTAGHALRILVLAWFRSLMRVGTGYRATRCLYRWVHRRLMGREAPEGEGGLVAKGCSTPVTNLGLQAGEWVRVKTQSEIKATLTLDNKNRGMWFDDEATLFCGELFEVQDRVERIINEVTGEMMHMKTPCITLRGVYCQSSYSRHRLFCPRAITPYWREAWLQREPR